MMRTRKPALIFLLATLFALSSYLGMRHIEQTVHQVSLRRTSELESPSSTSKPRLLDGCYHIFLDVGANIGVHGRFLFEPDKYNETVIAGKFFDQEFGKQRDNRDFCVVAFEPNPRQKKRLESLANAYKAMGWRYHYIPAGIGDRDGNMTFYHLHDERHMEWGFGSIRKVDPLGFAGQEEHVPVIRLASWLENEVRNRRAIPEKKFGEYEKPKVVMKFDVEGLEFMVLPDLLLSGSLCSTVDFLFGEFHYQDLFYPLEFPEHNFTLKDSTEAREFANNAIRMMQVSRSCITKYDCRDDESYLKDGLPLPEPATPSNTMY